ncbi:DUF962 domain-containing protein [Oxalobacteraceae bacterium]|nr:DUF962 domain-containing protein [Oxalobacteraceae bacterium]
MKTLNQQLAQYAAYHRDPRNVATHLVGVPMIMAAVVVLLSRPGFVLAELPLSPAVLCVAATLLYYFVLDIGMGCVMSALLLPALWLGAWSAAQATSVWLGIGLGGFVVGWIIQFIGHYFEGRKPAFVDDLVGLLIGPLFVVVEVLLMLGLRKDLAPAMKERAAA